MAEDHRGRIPPRDLHETSQYPPLREEDDRLRGDLHRSPHNMATGITLPSIQDYPPGPPRGPPPPLEPGARGAYSVSPSDSTNYPPRPPYSLPPVHSLADGRGHPPPQDPRQAMPYRPVAPPEPNGYYRGPPPGNHPYPHDPYQQYPYQQPQGAVMGHYDYRNGPNGVQQQASAPRQRTSIACRYCRKRKIRCSGYQTTADGKCLNCKKTGNECVFQPVSSGSTAFVPVQAIQNGVIAPGTQLFGAFGQPLPMGSQAPPQQQRQTPPQLPLPSPTNSSFYDDRMETGRRRPRGPDDEHHHGPRLPPPHPHQQEEDPRRRSPASAQSATPPTVYHTSYSRTQSSTPPTATYPLPTAGDRTVPARRDSPSSGQGHGHPPAAPSAPNNTASIMSLGNLMDHAPPRQGPPNGDSRDNIDNFMLGRLNKRT